MKKIPYILFAVFFFLPLTADASTVIGRPANLTGLVASWSFDSATVSGSSVTDTSGNSHTMTLTGTTAVAGKTGQARSYNGSSDYGIANLGTQPSSISVSLWFKANSTAEQSLVDFQDTSSPITSYHMTVLGIKGGALYGSYWNIADLTGPALSTGQWYHAVITYDNSTNSQKLYLNGVLVGSNTGPWSGPGTLYFYLAQRQQSCSFNDACGDNAAFFNGSIDDVKVFSRALSSAEVRVLYGGTSYIGRATSGNIVTSPLSNGLVGYWPLDGATTNWTTNKTSDISGQGNTGSLVSMSTTTSPAAGKVGQALQFNGSSNYITAGTALAQNFQNSSFSVSAWVFFRDTSSSDEAIASIGSSATDQIFHMLRRNDKMLMGFFFDDLAGSQTMAANRWYHVTETWDASTKRQSIYVNGALDASRTSSGSLNVPNGSTFYIAKYGSVFLPGSLDDVRVYNRALSASEVSQLYQIGQANVAHSPGPASNAGGINSSLVGYWTMDGSSINWRTNTMADQSGQGNTASLVSISTTTSPVAGKMGQALRFSGSGQHVSGSVAASASSFSVAAWMRYQGVVPASALTVALAYGAGGGPSTLWMGYFSDGKMAISNSTVDIKSSTIVNSTAWHYAVAVVTGGTLYAYMDGVLAGSTSMSSRSSNALIVGDYAGGGFPFPGSVDDVRVYNRALSASEVQLLYQMGR